MRFLLSALVFCAALTAATADTLLQRTAFMSTWPKVVVDLKLSAAQKTQQAGIMSAYSAGQTEAGDQTVPENAAKLKNLTLQTENNLINLLTAAQKARLKQIGLQQEGVTAFADAEVAAELKLTAAQSKRIAAISAGIGKAEEAYSGALGNAMAAVPRPGSDAASQKAYEAKLERVTASFKPREKQYLAAKAAGEKQVLAVLTPVQRKKWKAMLGKPLK